MTGYPRVENLQNMTTNQIERYPTQSEASECEKVKEPTHPN